MSENYVECLVKKETNVFFRLVKIVLIMLTVVFGVIMFIGSIYIFAFFIALLCAGGAYFINLQTNLEYEYLYIDKEISIDKIMAKTKRKKIATFEVERMEILAPVRSYHLDSYKNRTVRKHDFSAGKTEPDQRYVMFYDGSQKLLLNPSPEFLKAVKQVAPRKVFTD